jgi:hypothetical protein
MRPMTVGLLPQIVASVLFLLPVAVVLLGLAPRSTFVAEVAIWVPGTVAIDLLSCLIWSRAAHLDVVLVVSRVLWLAGGVVVLYRRRPRLESPRRASWRTIGIIAAAGVTSFLLSWSISRPYSIWDRNFHTPLVTMLHGQRLPFLSVFQHETVLHFHFLGDIMATALQVFSGGRLHASLALALQHDLLFGLIGVSLAAWLSTLSRRRSWILPAVMAVFLSGPFSVYRTGLGNIASGYSFPPLISLSYRPSISMAMLMMMGAVAALGLRLTEEIPGRRALSVMFACVAGLAISDEPSAALFGVGVGAVWLVYPRVVHARRPVGLALLVGLAASILVSNILFQAAIVPGGPVQHLRVVAPRAPGFNDEPLRLSTAAGLRALLMDIGPFVMVQIGLVGVAIRERSRAKIGLAVATGAVLIAALFGFTALDLNGFHIENHRFMTVCQFLFPVAAVVTLAQLPAGHWERLPLIGALLVAAASSVFWIQNGIGNPDEFFTNDVDCRESAGARMFEAPRPTYIMRKRFFDYSGCRAVFYPGTPNVNDWSGVLYNGWPTGGRQTLETLHRKFVGAGEPLAAACPVDEWASDVVCTYAMTHTACVPAGKAFKVCQLSSADREQLLADPW